LDTYYVTETSLGHLKTIRLKVLGGFFIKRKTYKNYLNCGVAERYDTPFFSAFAYSQKPTGFSRDPISRGNSVLNQRWIHDFGDFMVAICSWLKHQLLQVDLTLIATNWANKSPEMARDAYGSLYTYFVTNRSTANKIVMQLWLKPGDVVLIDRDCHKSHHYGLVLAGAYQFI
jgi:arginine decarboxylase